MHKLKSPRKGDFFVMGRLIQLYRIINILSLDVAFGAIVSALFFAEILHVNILPYGLAALGLTVWIIYTADHLRDARHIRKEASSARHLFHQQYFKVLVALLMVAVLVDLVLIFFIRHAVFVGGVMLTVLVALYLAVQSKLYFLKEIFVALLYTCGILLPSVAVAFASTNSFQALLIIQFFLIALLNLMIFSWLDADKDQSDNLPSFVTRFGKSFASTFIIILFGLLMALNVYEVVVYGLTIEAMILVMMMMVLLFVFVFRDRLQKNETYRLLGDAVFFLPALVCLWRG
jgi:hypothetical protein